MINMVNLLKLHILLFYASFACSSIFITVYYKTYTDASYDEIGTLFMLSALSGAFLRPIVCSVADRHGTYKQCLMAATGVFCLSTVLLSILPFYPHLLFAEPHPRLLWYLVALGSIILSSATGLIITFDDVFVIHRCRNSKTGEHFGQYRYFGSVGWAVGALGLALVDRYINLPYMVLPMASACLLSFVDLLIITQLQNIKHGQLLSTTIGNEHQNAGKQQKLAPSSIVAELQKRGAAAKPPLPIGPPSTNQTSSFTANFKTIKTDNQMQRSLPRATLQTVVVTSSIPTTTAAASTTTTKTMITCPLPVTSSGNCDSNKLARSESIGIKGVGQKISILLQLSLLFRLNKYDNHNMVKYLLTFVLLGAIIQVHYAFYLQFMTEVLNARHLFTLLFAFSAAVQIIICVGETSGLLWIARLAIQTIGRDAALMMCVVISGIRYAISSFLIGHLNIWVAATLEIQTGFLWGIAYTLMTETGSCYLSMLDKLLLIDTESNSDEEIKFIAHLEELKEVYSIESIRFALKATIQSIFNGALEGFGFALGPLMAGLWLNSNGNSLPGLYQDLTSVHLVILSIMVVVEFGLIRLLLGVRSKADRLRYY